MRSLSRTVMSIAVLSVSLSAPMVSRGLASTPHGYGLSQPNHAAGLQIAANKNKPQQQSGRGGDPQGGDGGEGDGGGIKKCKDKSGKHIKGCPPTRCDENDEGQDCEKEESGDEGGDHETD